jgi:hypothetical protein
MREEKGGQPAKKRKIPPSSKKPEIMQRFIIYMQG